MIGSSNISPFWGSLGSPHRAIHAGFLGKEEGKPFLNSTLTHLTRNKSEMDRDLDLWQVVTCRVESGAAIGEHLKSETDQKRGRWHVTIAFSKKENI